jgi:hypothetical protein
MRCWLLLALLVAAGCGGGTDGSSCVTNADCVAADYCALPLGSCAGAGTCKPRPQFCYALGAPVCGCDNTTYPNVCYAEKAGENEKAAGSCP